MERGLSGSSDAAVLERAFTDGLIVVSHDVNTMRAIAEDRVREGTGTAGLFLVPQIRRSRPVAESLVLIWSASQGEEWRDRIVYLPL